MINLSRKTEYGLMAINYLAAVHPGKLVNVGEIHRATAVPRELLAKILSELVRMGLADSCSGPNGGFRLSRPLEKISLAEVIAALEKRPALVDCAADPERCRLKDGCTIRGSLDDVNRRVSRVLEETPLSELFIYRRNRAGERSEADMESKRLTDLK